MSGDSLPTLPTFTGDMFEHLNPTDKTVDQFIPVKGKMCPYGGWCIICMNQLIEDSRIPEGDIFNNFFRDYPGHTRSYHGGPNFCKAHIGEKEKWEAERKEEHRKYVEAYKSKKLSENK